MEQIYKTLANTIHDNTACLSKLFVEMQQMSHSKPGDIYFLDDIATTIPLNIKDFPWYTHIDFVVDSNDCKGVGSACTFNMGVDVDLSIADTKFNYKFMMKEKIRLYDFATFQDGNSVLVVGQFPLKALWNDDASYTPESNELFIALTKHKNDWGSTSRHENDQKFYIAINPPCENDTNLQKEYVWNLTFEKNNEMYKVQSNYLGVAMWIRDHANYPHKRFIYTHINNGNAGRLQYVFIKYFGWAYGERSG